MLKADFFCNQCLSNQPITNKSDTTLNNLTLCKSCDSKANKNRKHAAVQARIELSKSKEVAKKSVVESLIAEKRRQTKERMDKVRFERELAEINQGACNYE